MNKLALLLIPVSSLFLLAACGPSTSTSPTPLPSPAPTSAPAAEATLAPTAPPPAPTSPDSNLTDQQLLDKLKAQPTDTVDTQLNQLNSSLSQ
ncbi:hypothetical protein M1116_04310 [Patescibacteria group bacterium]|nr:hypothetical protein [Patescibacteria group bacterium]